jgi:hypothetical protein
VGSFPNFCILHGNVGSFFHGETILVNCQRRVKWDQDSDPKSNHETNHKGSKGPKLVEEVAQWIGVIIVISQRVKKKGLETHCWCLGSFIQ